MNPAAPASSCRKSPVRSSVSSGFHPFSALGSPQTPSLPDAGPGRPRCGGRESKFLALALQAVVLFALRDTPAYAEEQKLEGFHAQGTMTVGEVKLQIVGGVVMNNNPMMVIQAPRFQVKPVEIDSAKLALKTAELSPKNMSSGVVANCSSDVVEFKEALFLSPEPERKPDGRGEMPFPLYLCLSPSAGAVWKGDVPLAVSKAGVWTVSSIAPDLYISCETDHASKVALRVQEFFVATKMNELSTASAIRFEQTSLANALAFQVNGKQFTLQRTVFAFLGKPAAEPSKETISVAASLAEGQQWYVESGPSKQYLTEFRFAADGQCLAVYANGLVIPLSAGERLRKDVDASDETAGQHFTEAIQSVVARPEAPPTAVQPAAQSPIPPKGPPEKKWWEFWK